MSMMPQLFASTDTFAPETTHKRNSFCIKIKIIRLLTFDDHQHRNHHYHSEKIDQTTSITKGKHRVTCKQQLGNSSRETKNITQLCFFVPDT